MAKVWLKIIWVTIAAFQWISNWLQEWNLNFSSIPSLWIHWILSFQVTAWFWLQLNDSWGKNLNSQISIRNQVQKRYENQQFNSTVYAGLWAAEKTFSGLVVCAENLRTCGLLVPMDHQPQPTTCQVSSCRLFFSAGLADVFITLVGRAVSAVHNKITNSSQKAKSKV